MLCIVVAQSFLQQQPRAHLRQHLRQLCRAVVLLSGVAAAVVAVVITCTTSATASSATVVAIIPTSASPVGAAATGVRYVLATRYGGCAELRCSCVGCRDGGGSSGTMVFGINSRSTQAYIVSDVSTVLGCTTQHFL